MPYCNPIKPIQLLFLASELTKYVTLSKAVNYFDRYKNIKLIK